MTTPEFDWTTILPEDERKKVLADRQAFFDSFPTKNEIEQAGREGRAAFAKACATVDARKETERLLWAAIDHIAGTLEQPTNPRAWDYLLIYCPRDALERRLAAILQRFKHGAVSPSQNSAKEDYDMILTSWADCREQLSMGRAAMLEVLEFLNSIEGDGYGGIAAYEIARAHIRDVV